MAIKSMVKYICIAELEDNIDKFKKAEKTTEPIYHSTYDDLHSEVFSKCPVGYQCLEPIALFHEVMWSMGLRRNENNKHVRDELHHALERWEYGVLQQPSMASLCVDIVKLTSSGPQSPRRLVIL